MTLWDGVLLVAGGAFAGVVNAVAGGGSILTVPLLVIAGVPGNFANGSNRLGILTSTAASSASFHRLGVGGLAHAAPILVPVLLGSLVGSMAISQLTDDTFETVFGLLMLPLVLLSLRQPRAVSDGVVWSPTVTFAVFLAIGVYGGAIQAGVGLVLLAALSRAGFDLVTANHIKALITLAVTLVALPVFVWQGNVVWIPALTLAAGLTAGGWIGARVAFHGGERLIRAVMVVAALGLSAKLLGVLPFAN
jgi:uncharacterized membrane protein YfcA